MPGPSRRLPWVPTEEQVQAFYEAVWRTRRTADLVLIKTFLYTGVRVCRLVVIRLADVDLDACQIRVNLGKGARTGWCLFRGASGNPGPAYPPATAGGRDLPVRVVVEAALQRPGDSADAGAVHRAGRHRPHGFTAQEAAALSVDLA